MRFYALGLALARLSGGWRGFGPASAEAAIAGERLLGTAGIITTAVKALLSARPKRRRARIMYLGDDEQQILFEIERLAGDKPVLLIADNLHWWDSASLELLGRFREPRLRESFQFLSDMRVLASQTEQRFQPVAHALERDALLSEPGMRLVELQRISRERFADVLVAMGAPDSPPDVVDAIYSLSGGHLALASRCAARLAQDDAASFLAAQETDEFVSRLLSDRLRSLGSVGTEALDLLRIAAVIGTRFRRDQVACVWDGDDAEISHLLRFLRDEEVLQLSGEAGWFVHELYQRHFLSSEAFDRVALHERLSDCLRVLSPGNYALRCDNAMRAERQDDAAALGLLAALASLREGHPWDDLPQPILNAIHAGGLTPVVQRLAQAVGHLAGGRPDACAETLLHLPHALDKRVAAEVDYLRAVSLMESRSGTDQDAARQLLAGWAGYEAEEPDIGVRLMLLRLYAMAMTPDNAAAREVESEIKRFLRDRVSFDRAAEDALYTLDRCSPAIVTPETALLRTRDAANHFAAPEGHETVRRPIEYYRSLANHAAEFLLHTDFERAVEVSSAIEALVLSYAPGTFPRVEDPLSNGLQAELRLGRIGPSEAVECQRQIIAEHASPNDPFYVENALGAYLSLDGQFGPAVDLYDRLLHELASRRNPIPSIEYLLRANRTATRFVAGNRDGVLSEWTALGRVVQRVPYPTAPMLVRRHELLHRVLELGTQMTPSQFDECLIVGRAPEFGPLWGQIGRGFRVPELEWFH